MGSCYGERERERERERWEERERAIERERERFNVFKVNHVDRLSIKNGTLFKSTID